LSHPAWDCSEVKIVFVAARQQERLLLFFLYTVRSDRMKNTPKFLIKVALKHCSAEIRNIITMINIPPSEHSFTFASV